MLIGEELKSEVPDAENLAEMTRTSRTLSLLVAFAAVWAQTPATHARPAAASAPTISISNATLKEGDSGTTKAVFKVTLSKGARAKVHYATHDLAATAGSDYGQAEGTLTFRDGETVRRIVVKVLGDPTPEPDERFHVILSNPDGATIADHKALGTITDDDGSGSGTSPSLSIGDATVTEGNSGTTPAVFGVTLSEASAGAVTVDFATAAGSATAAVDFHPATGTLTFNPGETAKSVTVKVDGDTTVETDETFLVVLSNASGATIAGGTGLGTITNDDTVPSISIAAATVAEGNSGTTSAVFNLTLSAPSVSTVTVDYATADGSAVSPGDYASGSGTVTFNPGQISRQIVVQVQGDTAIETNEIFSVALSNPTNATVAGSGSATGTITNDDALPSISIAAATVTEGNSGNTAFVFNLTLSAPSVSTVTVDYATADGSAVAPGDYTAGSGTVTFNPGQISRQVVVQVQGDTLNETNETFSVALSNPTNAIVAGSGFATGTITNNDAIPTLSINNVTALEGNAGSTNFIFTVTLSAASGQTITVGFATANGSAIAPGDYVANSGTVTFNPGTTTQTITIQVVGDPVVEANETFTANLSNATNATVSGTGVGTGTITNDD